MKIKEELAVPNWFDIDVAEAWEALAKRRKQESRGEVRNIVLSILFDDQLMNSWEDLKNGGSAS